jgi:hypothetical protein
MDICFIPPLENTKFLEKYFDIYGANPKIDRLRREHNIEWGKKENYSRANGQPPHFIRSLSYSKCIRGRQKGSCQCWICQGVEWGIFSFKNLGIDDEKFLIYGTRGD